MVKIAQHEMQKRMGDNMKHFLFFGVWFSVRVYRISWDVDECFLGVPSGRQ